MVNFSQIYPIENGSSDPFASQTILFLGSSLILPGNQTIQVASQSGFNFENSDFTVEFEYNFTQKSNFSAIVSRDGSDYPWMIYHNNTAANIFANFGNSSSWIVEGISMGIPTNSNWNHYAVSRSGSTFRGFKDGSLIETKTGTGSISQGNSSNLILGGNSSFFVTGQIKNLRITLAARYVSSFSLTERYYPY